jgi:ubiquinone/menaquinone biosynthesis C-methylase UbiE
MKEPTSTTTDTLISESKNSFNELLKTPEYQALLSDDAQRERLIRLLKIQPKSAYLDLATGAGYVGFAIAEQCPDCSVTGVDIADEIISDNLKKIKEQSLTNIDFKLFNGIHFPDFKINYEGVICRYAMHHFPKIEITLEEINKVLKNEGRVVISDSIRNEHDNENFINKYQGIKKDGHIRMYTRNELVRLFEKHNFTEAESFYSEVTVSRELSIEYKNLLETTSSETKKSYSVVVGDNKVTLTFNILNIAFTKNTDTRMHST